MHLAIATELSTKLETKASPRRQCAPAGYSNTNANYADGVNNYLNSNHTKYVVQLCGRFFCVLENFRRKFANLVAPPTDGTMKRLVHCKAYPVL